MKEHLTILKSFFFSIFILTSFVSFAMEESENENLVFKGFINLTDQQMKLYFGTFPRKVVSPALDVKPYTSKLIDHIISKDEKGRYEKFSILNVEMQS